MKKEDLTVGQTVYLQPYGNAAKYSKEIKEDTIVSIGRKYAELCGKGKFSIATGYQKTDYTPTFIVWVSRDALDLQVEHNGLIGKIHAATFDLSGHNIEQLRNIYEAIKL